MALVRWDPIHDLAGFEIDRLFPELRDIDARCTRRHSRRDAADTTAGDEDHEERGG